MKLTINGVSVCFDKIPKEIIVNGSEYTIINEENVSSIDNPKLVDYYYDFEGQETFTGVVKDEYGTIAHYVNGKLHQDNGPAVEWSNGNKAWYTNNKLHREDGAAIEHTSGYKQWFFDGGYYGCDFTDESWIAFVATLKAAKRK